MLMVCGLGGGSIQLTARQQHDEEQEQPHPPVPVYVFEDREPLIGIVSQ